MESGRWLNNPGLLGQVAAWEIPFQDCFTVTCYPRWCACLFSDWSWHKGMGLCKDRSPISTFRSRENKSNTTLCHGPSRLFDLAKTQGRCILSKNGLSAAVWKGDDGQSFGIGYHKQKAFLEEALEDECTQQNKNFPLACVLLSTTNNVQSIQEKGSGRPNLLALRKWAWDYDACFMVLPNYPYSLGVEVWVVEEGLPNAGVNNIKWERKTE